MAQSKITLEQYIGYRKKYAVTGKKKADVGKIVAFVILALFSLIWVLPFFIMLFGSLRGHQDLMNHPGKLFNPPSGFTLESYKILLFNEWPETMQHNSSQKAEIGYWLMNSCFSAVGGTCLYLLVASLAAYAFTFIDFRYRNVLFGILIGTLVIPGVATSVGNQSLVYDLGLNKSILALIIPGLGGVYGMYLIRTFFSSIPKDLIESAKMDGYSNLKIFTKIVLPLGKTVIFVQGLFGFMGAWNDLVWPQMLYGTKDTKLWTLQVGMAYVINNSKANVNSIGFAFAGGVLCVLPVLVVYLIAQDKIIEGMASTGVKR